MDSLLRQVEESVNVTIQHNMRSGIFMSGQWLQATIKNATSIYNNSLLSIHAPVDEHVGRTNGAVGAGSQVTNIGIVGPARLVSVAKSISHVVFYN